MSIIANDNAQPPKLPPLVEGFRITVLRLYDANRSHFWEANGICRYCRVELFDSRATRRCFGSKPDTKVTHHFDTPLARRLAKHPDAAIARARFLELYDRWPEPGEEFDRWRPLMERN